MASDRNETPGQPAVTVWPAFVVPLAAIAVTIVVQIVVAIGLTIGHVAGGGEPDPDAIREATEGLFLSPMGFLAMAAIGQIAFLGCVWIATWRLPGRRAEQLGSARPRLPASTYFTLILGTGVPLAVGIGMSWLVSLAIEPAIKPERIWAQITPVTFLPYVLFIALAPGFIEEITFRGFVQRRLMGRWSPRKAIAWSSILFAIAHVDPHHCAFALPIGIWLGVIAWRLDSTWPGIACHAALNGLWSIYFILAVKADASTAFYTGSAIVVGAISVVGFIASGRILARGKPRLGT